LAKIDCQRFSLLQTRTWKKIVSARVARLEFEERIWPHQGEHRKEELVPSGGKLGAQRRALRKKKRKPAQNANRKTRKMRCKRSLNS